MPLAELWRDPGRTRQDLFHGPGGRRNLPEASGRFVFLEKDTSGKSPGYDVRDGDGREWSVKLGVEARPEVVVSRVLWACGFHQDPTYYVPQWTLSGGDAPGPQPPGRFRLKPPGFRKLHDWSFFENPFLGTRPYKGLLLILLVLNDWDLRDSNNTVYEIDPPEDGVRRWYVVKDVGASLGGSSVVRHQGSKDDLPGFRKTGFVEGYDGDRVDLAYSGRYYHGLYRQHEPADVRWACERLGGLSDRQWKDAFRASGYSVDETEAYLAKIREKLRSAQAVAALAVAP